LHQRHLHRLPASVHGSIREEGDDAGQGAA
jgi:hypothetical protein